MPFPWPTTAHAQPQMQKVRKARKARKARKERKGRKGQRERRKGQRERQRAQLVAQRLMHASGRQRDRWSSALVSHGDPWRWGPRGRTTTGRAPREYRESRRSRLVAAPVAAPVAVEPAVAERVVAVAERRVNRFPSRARCSSWAPGWRALRSCAVAVSNKRKPETLRDVGARPIWFVGLQTLFVGCPSALADFPST